MSNVSTGMLNDAIPYLKVGDGPPLVMVQGLTATHEVPKGMERRMALSSARALSRNFSAYVVNRKQGLEPGESMSDIAGHLAAAIETDLGEPVFLTGTSTGGSVALQLAVDRPDLVRGLVVIASAYRLGPKGRHVQQELAQLTRAGQGAEGWARLMTAMLPEPLQTPASPAARMMMRSMTPDDPTDLLATLDAEDAFDVKDRLQSITAPTLVIGGTDDIFYPTQMFQQTADGVPDGRAYIHEGWGHMRTAASSATTNLTLGFLLACRRG